MTASAGLWRATYTPGDWVVLAGPTSLVVLEPAGDEATELIESLWSDVVGSSSISEIIGHLAGSWGIGMPSFGVFFWTEEGMRSLVRGEVSVVDPATGLPLAVGEGMHTWSEVGLGEHRAVGVRLGAPQVSSSLALPLVVGAVRASSLTLDASDDAVPASPQLAAGPSPDTSGSVRAVGGGFVKVLPGDATAAGLLLPPLTWGGQAPADADTEEFGEADGPFMIEDGQTRDTEDAEAPEPGADGGSADDHPDDQPELEGDATELMALADLPALDTGTQDAPDAGTQDSPAADPGAVTQEIDPELQERIENGETELMSFPDLTAEEEGPRVLAVTCPYGHANPEGQQECRVCGTPVPPQPARPVVPPVLATLRVSDGSYVELDGSVVVGRAPSAGRASTQPVQLLTVVSPGHDISRTHLEVTVAGWQVEVTDLHSTNGTILVGPGGAREDLAPGQPLVAELGSVVELGDGVSILIDLPQ